ncbi:MAG: hypothetical protein WBG90_17290 [Saonia sp.]
MKTLQQIYFLIGFFMSLTLLSCGPSDSERDKHDIVEVLKSETETFVQGNFDLWANHWKQSSDVLFTYTANNETNFAIGWEKLSGLMKQHMDTGVDLEYPDFSRDYHTIRVEGNMAWAHFTQIDTLDGKPTQKHESRTLERVNGDWKIIGANIVNQTSFASNQYLLNAKEVHGETHISLEEFPKGMIINHVEGWGGMTVAINEPPAGTDFTPLLEGLENNSCQVPHWGYLEKGAIRMKYDDGKEEVLKAGEVFYMPPGHTGVVEKDVRLIDFSPQQEFKEVVHHIEEKVAAMQKQ